MHWTMVSILLAVCSVLLEISRVVDVSDGTKLRICCVVEAKILKLSHSGGELKIKAAVCLVCHSNLCLLRAWTIHAHLHIELHYCQGLLLSLTVYINSITDIS